MTPTVRVSKAILIGFAALHFFTVVFAAVKTVSKKGDHFASDRSSAGLYVRCL